MAAPIVLGITIRANGSAQVTGEMNRVRDGLRGAGSAADQSNRQFAALGGALRTLGGLFGGLSLAALAQNMTKTIEQVQIMSLRLKGLTKSAQDYAEVQSYLSNLAKQHHKDNLVLAASFSRLLAVEETGIITRHQSKAILEGLSNAQSKTGATAENLSQSMVGLTQALSSGTLQWEEMKQVTEPIPGLMTKIAEAAGFVGTSAVGDFKKVVSAGQVTSDMFGRILVEALGQYQGAAEAAGDTLTANYADIRNAWIDLAAVIEEPVADVITPVLKGIASVVQGLAQDFKELKQFKDALFGVSDKGGASGSWNEGGASGSWGDDSEAPAKTASATALAIRKEIEANATAKTGAAVKHRAASRAIAQGLSEEERAARSLQLSFDNEMKALALRNVQLTQSARDYEIATLQGKNYNAAMIEQLMIGWDINAAWEIKKQNDAVQKTTLDDLIDKYNQLTLSARDYFQLTMLNKGISPENQAVNLAQFDKNAALEASQQTLAETRQALDAYIASLDSAAASTSDLGDVTSAVFDGALGGINTLIGAFKNVTKQLDDNTKKLAKNSQQQLLNNKLAYSPEKIANTKKLFAEQTRLEQENTALQLSGIRQVAGAAAQMYEEGSTARRVLHGIEMVAGIAELAQQISLLTVKGANAVLTQGEGDPYSAFARIAAMIGIVAGIISAAGGTFGAGGSGSKVTVPRGTKDTGTVLGDLEATSDSANRVYELLKAIHSEEYVELRGINRGIAGLHDAITGTITKIYQSDKLGTGIYDPSITGLGSKFSAPQVGFGSRMNADPILNYVLGGLFGTTTKKEIVGGGLATAPIAIADVLKGELIGAAQYSTIQTTKKGGWLSGGKTKTGFDYVLTQVDESVQQSLTQLFQSVGETMISLADLLGDGVSERVRDYIIPTVLIELRGLNAEDATKKLNGVISTIIDTMADSVFGDIIGQYQQLGEGMLETAVRIVAEVAVVRDALAQSGVKLAGNAIEIADALVQAAGGLEEFQKQFDSFYDKFFSDIEKQQRLTEMLQGRLEGFFTQETINILGTARDRFRQVMSALDLNNAADRERYSLLLSLADAGDRYYTGLEAAADLYQAELEAAAERLQQLNDLLKDLYRAEAVSIAGQMIEKYTELITRARELGANLAQILLILNTGQQEANDLINAALTDLLRTFTAFAKNLQTARNSINANITTLGGAALSRDPVYQQGIIDRLYQQLATAANNADKVGIINELNAAVMDRYNAELEMLGKVSESIKQIRDYLDRLLLSEKSPLTNAAKLGEAQAQYATQLALASAGDKDALAGITNSADAYLTQARTFYASGADYTAIFSQVTAALAALGRPAGMDEATYKAETLRLQGTAISELQSLDVTLQAIYLSEQANFDRRNAELINQLAVIGDIVHTEIAYLLAPMNAMLAWGQSALGRELTGFESGWVNTQYMASVPEPAIYAEAQSYIDNQNLQAAIQTLMTEAIAALGRGLSDFESQWIISEFSYGRSKTSIYDEAFGYINSMNGSHAGGLDFVPFDGYRAELHKGERVLTSGQARRQDNAASQEIVAELKALRQEVERLRAEQRAHTGALIQSNYDANDRASDKVVTGGKEAAKEAAWAARSKAVIT